MASEIDEELQQERKKTQKALQDAEKEHQRAENIEYNKRWFQEQITKERMLVDELAEKASLHHRHTQLGVTCGLCKAIQAVEKARGNKDD